MKAFVDGSVLGGGDESGEGEDVLCLATKGGCGSCYLSRFDVRVQL